jgi:hypothetical protein
MSQVVHKKMVKIRLHIHASAGKADVYTTKYYVIGTGKAEQNPLKVGKKRMVMETG